MNDDDCAAPGDELRDGLKALEQQEAMIAALREALAARELSGAATAFDIEAFIAGRRASPPNS